MADRWAALAAAGSARGAPAGFRRAGRRAERRQKLRKPAADPTRGQPAPVGGVAPTVAAGHRPPGGPGAAGCRRPTPARSSGRPARDDGAAGWPSRGSAWRSGWCAPGRSGARRRATASRDPGCRTLPPQPQHLGWAGVGRHALDLDADQGAAHDRARLLGSSGGVQLLLGMQPGPGLYVHATILVVVFDVPAARRRPGAWVAGVVLGAMTAWPAALAGRNTWWRVGVETAPRTQPHQNRGGHIGQPQPRAGWVIAWSIPSLVSLSGASGSAACRRRSTPLPRRQTGLPCLRRPGRVRTRPYPRTHQRRASCCPVPWPPRRPAVGANWAQAPGSPGDVRIRAVHGGGDRQDSGGQPRLDLPAPHSRRRQPNLTVRPKPWTLRCECALKEVRSPGESVGKGR
jgi:hypothetical protein